MAVQIPSMHLNLCQPLSTNCHIKLAYSYLYTRRYPENAWIKGVSFPLHNLILVYLIYLLASYFLSEA